MRSIYFVSFLLLEAMLGGRLVGQGLYGCVFSTPLSCKKGTEQETKRPKGSKESKGPKGPKGPKTLKEPKGPKAPTVELTKLTTPIDADIELSMGDTIRRIPLWRNYFAVAESMCVPSQKQKEKELNACEILHDRPLSDFRALRMADAGTPLDHYAMNMKTFHVMRFATHLLEAGALLTLFGVVHRDLHQGNVVVDPHQVPRIIDFNLAIPIATKGDLEALVSHQYDYRISHEPPDSTLLMAVAQGKRVSSAIHMMVTKKRILVMLRSLLGMSEAELERQLEDVAQEPTVRAGDSAAWFRAHWRTIDSWGIGVMLLDLLSKWSMWPAFNAQFAPYREKMYHVIRQMCVIHPAKRMDCVEALQFLHPTSGILRAYGSKWLQALRRVE